MSLSVGQQQKESFAERTRRIWRSRKSVRPAVRIAVAYMAVLALVAVGLFLWTASNTNGGDAFDIMAGSASAFTLHAGAPGVALAIVGYLFIPAVIGAVVATVVTARGERKMRSQAEMQQDLTAMITREVAKQVANSQLGGAADEVAK